MVSRANIYMGVKYGAGSDNPFVADYSATDRGERPGRELVTRREAGSGQPAVAYGAAVHRILCNINRTVTNVSGGWGWCGGRQSGTLGRGPRSMPWLPISAPGRPSNSARTSSNSAAWALLLPSVNLKTGRGDTCCRRIWRPSPMPIGTCRGSRVLQPLPRRREVRLPCLPAPARGLGQTEELAGKEVSPKGRPMARCSDCHCGGTPDWIAIAGLPEIKKQPAHLCYRRCAADRTCHWATRSPMAGATGEHERRLTVALRRPVPSRSRTAMPIAMPSSAAIRGPKPSNGIVSAPPARTQSTNVRSRQGN